MNLLYHVVPDIVITEILGFGFKIDYLIIHPIVNFKQASCQIHVDAETEQCDSKAYY